MATRASRTIARRLTAAVSPSASARPLPATPTASGSGLGRHRLDSRAVRALSSTAPSRRTSASQSVYTTGAACPGCGAPMPPALTPVCPHCSALLPPPPPATTYYDLFGIDPPAFRIDAAQLKRAFLTLQQKVHPDLFSGRGESEDWAKAWSGRVNDAYKALLNERERAEYLLSIHGVTIGEADPVTDPDLLMTIMETREELEEAESEQDVTRIRDRNKAERARVIEALSTAFGANSEPDLEEARNLVIELRYLDNIEQVCREWQPGKRVELQH
ncbi:hypothetical protein JCM3774_001328 [Rhodotorula dairenensis]